MFLLRLALLALTVSASTAFACTCSPGPPIQKGMRPNDAVFKARVIGLLSPSRVYEGKRYARKALAVVEHRYWGLPDSWPSLVILDGGVLCNAVLEDKTEYLVAGRPGWFWTVDVSGCSRTAPLRDAKIDLRTIDGSICSQPGKNTGTLLGRFYNADRSPAPNTALDLIDNNGKRWPTRSDADGIFELRHVSAGKYVVDSNPANGMYTSGWSTVTAGECSEAGAHKFEYSVMGSLPRHLLGIFSVELLDPQNETTVAATAEFTEDGRFYFAKVPPGQYLLTATSRRKNEGGYRVYYPGTTQRSKAVAVRLDGKLENFAFPEAAFPYLPVRVLVEDPNRQQPVPVQLHTEKGEVFYLDAFTPYTLFALRGSRMRLNASTYSPYAFSDLVWIQVEPGLKEVRLILRFGQ